MKSSNCKCIPLFWDTGTCCSNCHLKPRLQLDDYIKLLLVWCGVTTCIAFNRPGNNFNHYLKQPTVTKLIVDRAPSRVPTRLAASLTILAHSLCLKTWQFLVGLWSVLWQHYVRWLCYSVCVEEGDISQQVAEKLKKLGTGAAKKRVLRPQPKLDPARYDFEEWIDFCVQLAEQ